jgi:hypothetical protein
MKSIANILWNNPSAFAGAVQAGNAVAAAEGVVPAPVAVLVAVVTATVNYAVVKPARRKR